MTALFATVHANVEKGSACGTRFVFASGLPTAQEDQSFILQITSRSCGKQKNMSRAVTLFLRRGDV